MPSFSHLSDSEINAITRYILSWQQVGRIHLNVTPVVGDKHRGEQLFRQNCERCHGAHGEGDRGTGVTFSRPRSLPIIPPALNSPGFLASATDIFIKNSLIYGRGDTPMVSFAKKGLSDQQLNDIVSYVRSFQQPRKDTSKSRSEYKSPVLSYKSSSNFKDTVENVKQAIVSANFVLIRVQTLDSGMMSDKEVDPRDELAPACDEMTSLYRNVMEDSI